VTHLGYRCFAKVNLTLEVLRRREDGYHELASLVHTISLADDLHLESAESLLSQVEGLDIGPEANLVTRAARLFFRAAQVPPGIRAAPRKTYSRVRWSGWRLERCGYHARRPQRVVGCASGDP